DKLRMPVTFFRVPYGSRCKRVEKLLGERHLSHLHWDLDAHEWENHDRLAMKAYYTRNLMSLQGRAVILMHDTQPTTMHALPLILDWIDKENARRHRLGLRQIRILSYAD